MARIGIDCDGVLANFVREFVRLFNIRFPGRNITEAAWTSWGGGDQFTKKEEKEIWKIIRATENFWLGIEAYRENVSALAQFLATNSGHDVWVITSRAGSNGLSTARQTELWLQSCGLRGGHNYLGVITVPDSDDKVDICSRLDIDYMIDDKVETIEQFDRFPYFRAALLDHTWNQMARPKWRVSSVGEFLQRVR